jgi:hypothetical protein
MHTRADIDLQGRTATLRQGDRTLTARILEPEGAKFEVMPADAPPPEAQNSGVRKLAIRTQAPKDGLRIAVALSPGKQAITPDLRPLSAWISEGRITSKPGD